LARRGQRYGFLGRIYRRFIRRGKQGAGEYEECGEKEPGVPASGYVMWFMIHTPYTGLSWSMLQSAAKIFHFFTVLRFHIS
jgi:hypothetical protein